MLADPAKASQCVVCSYRADQPDPVDLGSVRGNTARFADVEHAIWRCPRCLSLHSLAPVDFASLYADYPMNERHLDVFAKGTLRNLEARLRRAGLRRDHAVLDYGCGNGVFIEYLSGKRYTNVRGYDPYLAAFATPPAGEQFDFVIANDVIEHVPDPAATIAECARLVRPGGVLYLGTADAAGVDIHDLERQRTRMHQPYHRVIVTGDTLQKLAATPGLVLERAYRRSYMDTFIPFCNYRFLDEFQRALGYVMERAFDPSAGRILLRRPWLLFFALFGYWFPSAYEPAVVLRKPTG